MIWFQVSGFMSTSLRNEVSEGCRGVAPLGEAGLVAERDKECHGVILRLRY